MQCHTIVLDTTDMRYTFYERKGTKENPIEKKVSSHQGGNNGGNVAELWAPAVECVEKKRL